MDRLEICPDGAFVAFMVLEVEMDHDWEFEYE